MSPQEVYDRLVETARAYPFDYNIRNAPLMFESRFNELVREEMKQ